MTKLIFLFIFIFLNIANSQEVLFEDFNYQKINIITAEDSAKGSIFGFNDWIYKDGIKQKKAWYRWNIAEPKYAEYSNIELTKEGIALNMNKGLTDMSKTPLIHSSFYAKHGQFVSRVKFDSFKENNFIIQAYWLFAPYSYVIDFGGRRINYTSEMDFEFNNFFLDVDLPTMSAGVNGHYYFYNQTKHLEISLFDKGEPIQINNFDNKYKGKNIFFDQWYIAVISNDTVKKQTKFYLVSDFDNEPELNAFVGYKTKNANEINPYVVEDYVPDYNMLTIYSMHCQPPILENHYRLETDWYYYTPDAEISVDSIKQNIQRMRSQNISRINTANLDFFVFDKNSKIMDCYIKGSDTAIANVENIWIIDSKYQRFTSYKIDFKYRFRDSNGIWSSWLNNYSNRLKIIPDCRYDSLEMKVHFDDFWSDVKGEINKSVSINCDSKAETKSTIQISDFAYHTVTNFMVFYYDVLEDSDISMDIYDINGLWIDNLLQNKVKAGNYIFEKKVNELSSGVYFLVVKSNSEIKKMKFMNFRN